LTDEKDRILINEQHPSMTQAADKADLDDKHVVLLLHQIELLLSEKRTSLSVMRTGIAILALPLSVFSILIATSRLYDVSDVMHFLVPVLGISIFLIGLSGYLIVRSLRRFHKLDQMIKDIKARSPVISDLVTCKLQ
jgi:uncharacterized membrane protein YidH (DUF202 family)